MAMINCPECNREVSDEAEKCPNCGYILQKRHSITGVIGFVLSIVSLFFGTYLRFILSAIALILCIVGCLQKNKKHIFPIIGNVLSIIIILAYLILFLYLYKAI